MHTIAKPIAPTPEGERATPIAIVGLACRFPDADDPLTLFESALAGRRSFRRLPPGRLGLAAAGGPAPRAALLEGWQFSRAEFGVAEAAYQAADPAHWLALETAGRALADAGFPGGQGLAGDRAGVLLGNTLTGEVSRAAALRSQWPFVATVLEAALAAGAVPPAGRPGVLRHAAGAFAAPFPEPGPATLAGSQPGAIAGRVCRHFGFRGGGQAVDAAHSSALLAVATGCALLAAGELDFVLAGGVDISLDPFELGGLAQAGLLTAGPMRIYDSSPTGFLPGEGCGIIALMRAADARAADMPSYADIVGWGTSSAGLPSNQLLALQRAYQRAAVAPGEVQFIEGDGRGTADADLAELTALTTIRAGAPAAAALSSVKANIGHTKAAAGAAGLIKAALAVNAGVIPPITGCVHPHPLLSDPGAVLRVPRSAESWPGRTRLAAVSSIDPAGSTVHLVLRRDRHQLPGPAQPPSAAPQPSPAEHPSPSGQPAAASPGDRTLAAWSVPSTPRAEAFTFSGPDRAALARLLSQVAAAAPDLSDAELSDLACQSGREADPGPVRVALVATHQDELSRLCRTAAGLLPGLRTGQLTTRPGLFAADRAAGQVALLFPGELAATGAGQEPPGPAAAPAIAQFSLNAIRWLDGLGLRAAAAVGQGVGEITALVWAGSLAEATAVRLIAARTAALTAAGSRADRSAALREVLADTEFAVPAKRLISAVTGREVAPGADIRRLLCDQITEPVRLAEALRTVAARVELLLDTGPGQAMAGLAAGSDGSEAVPVVSLAAGPESPAAPTVAAALFAAGAVASLAPLLAGRPARQIDLSRPRVFITNPCAEVVSAAGAAATTATESSSVPPDAAPARPTSTSATGTRAADTSTTAASTPAETSAAPAGAGPISPAGTSPAGTSAAETNAAATSAAEIGAAATSAGTTGTRAADTSTTAASTAGTSTAETSAALASAAPVRTAPISTGGTSAPPTSAAPTSTPPTSAAPTSTAGTSATPTSTAGTSAPESGAAPTSTPGANAAGTSTGPAGATGTRAAAAGVPATSAPTTSAAGASASGASASGASASGASAPATSSAGTSIASTGPAPASAAPASAAETAIGSTGPAPTSASPTRAAATDAPPTGAPSTGGPATGEARTSAAGTGAAGTGASGTNAPATSTTGIAAPLTGAAGTDAAPASPPATGPGSADAGPTSGRPSSGGPTSAADPYPGVGPWLRCFTEELRPSSQPEQPVDEEPWRLHATTRQPFGRMAAEVFEDDPAATSVLAVIGDLADPDGSRTLIAAAKAAITAGSLVVITPSAGLAGFCASLHAEHPSLGITLIRTADSMAGLLAAQRFAATEPGRFRELALDAAGAAREPVMVAAVAPDPLTRPEPDRDAAGQLPGRSAGVRLGPSDVVLVSGGPAGDILALAQLLADSGARLALVGGPARPAEVAAVDLAVAGLRRTGTVVSYATADITDPDQAEAVVARIEQQAGPVTAVCYPASSGPRSGCTELPADQVRELISAQADGLSNLLGAVRAARLRLLMTVSPLPARYGAARHGAASLSAAALAEQARRLGQSLPGCRVLHADVPWPPGRSPATPAELGRLLMNALGQGPAVTRIAIHGRLGRGTGPASGAKPGGRFLETVRVHFPRVELVAEAQVSTRTDPYLADYVLDGRTVLPPVIGLEAMAQAAAALAGRPLHDLADVSMEAPVVLPPGDRETTLRVCALLRDDAVETVLRAAGTGFSLDHLRAFFPLRPGTDSAGRQGEHANQGAAGDRLGLGAAVPGSIVDGTDVYGPICFQHGPFRRVAFLTEVTARSCHGLVRGADDRPWFSGAAGPAGQRPSSTLILGSPGLNDAVMHMLQASVPDRRVLPAGFRSLTLTGDEVCGAVQVRAERAAGAAGTWEVSASDATGRPVLSLTGLRLREAGNLAPGTPWHPTLLAAAIEGRGTELGLDPALRVSLRCGLPPGPEAPPPPTDLPWVDTSAGTGSLAGFQLTAQASIPVACHWETTQPRATEKKQAALAAPEELARQLRERYAGQPATASARLRAIIRCLAAAGWPNGSEPQLDAARDPDWARVRAGRITVACTVAILDGVPQPVAIALATWPTGDAPADDGPAASGLGDARDNGASTAEPPCRPAGTGGSLGRPDDSLGRHSVVG